MSSRSFVRSEQWCSSVRTASPLMPAAVKQRADMPIKSRSPTRHKAKTSASTSTWTSVGIVRYDIQKSRLLLRKRQPQQRPRRLHQSSWTYLPLCSTSRTASTAGRSHGSSGYRTASVEAELSSLAASQSARVGSNSREGTSQHSICITIRSSGCSGVSKPTSYATPASGGITAEMSCSDSDRMSGQTVLAVALPPAADVYETVKTPVSDEADNENSFVIVNQEGGISVSDSKTQKAVTVAASSRSQTANVEAQGLGREEFSVKAGEGVNGVLNRLRNCLAELLTRCLRTP
ncbi:hypothetical protein BOX15_Mlig023082g5 [Macrostomum lignano]|uniref:Uncharacterized protein n=1 Tax=Macrostomum lignano TaxID=282301 RepID=A0A267G5E5_9PLAT|nr:hypothetical protein BOX15_Mlig023082g5 [Macrostomum lignano]